MRLAHRAQRRTVSDLARQLLKVHAIYLVHDGLVQVMEALLHSTVAVDVTIMC
jgi:uncharacterized protein YkvS